MLYSLLSIADYTQRVYEHLRSRRPPLAHKFFSLLAQRNLVPNYYTKHHYLNKEVYIACAMMVVRSKNMNKVAQYLNQHLSGEAVTNSRVRAAHAADGSILHLMPEMVVFPRQVSDIRKVTRFSTQIAEKGHSVGVTARGSGTDKTGGAIGRGIIVNLSKYMHKINEFDVKQKLIRLESGTSVQSLSNTLRAQGMGVEKMRWDEPHGTVGGAVASSLQAQEYIDQMEVVLSNGDLMHVKKLSKREVGQKKGQQNFEGEIYRKLDALIEEKSKVLDELVHKDDRFDNSGYSAIEQVKARDGSFDLRPLFCGSQGTLAVISEMILKVDYINQAPIILVAAFKDESRARDALDVIEAVNPTDIQYVMGDYITVAAKAGKTIEHFDEITKKGEKIDAMIVVTINDFSAKARAKKLKKLQKKLGTFEAVIVHSNDKDKKELSAAHTITDWFLNPEDNGLIAPPLFDGMFIPLDRFDLFTKALDRIAAKHKIKLPLYGRPMEDLWYVRPQLRLTTTQDKRKLFELASEIAAAVNDAGGSVFGASSEGRIHSPLSSAMQSDEVKELYKDVKEIFDPHNILNPGVKQPVDVHDLTKQLRSEYSVSAAVHGIASY